MKKRFITVVIWVTVMFALINIFSFINMRAIQQVKDDGDQKVQSAAQSMQKKEFLDGCLNSGGERLPSVDYEAYCNCMYDDIKNSGNINRIADLALNNKFGEVLEAGKPYAKACLEKQGFVI